MSLSKLAADLSNIAKLDDEPNDVGGMTAADLKAQFDAAGNTIKAYINDTLTEEAASKAEIQGIVLGQIPDGTITEEKLETSVSNKINTAVQPEGMIDTAVALSDDVATALGLTGNPQVKDALNKLKTLVDAAQTTAGGRAQIATGSYTGTGAYESNSPNKLTFTFYPKVLFLFCDDQDTYLVPVMFYGIQDRRVEVYKASAATFSSFVSFADKSVLWYGNSASVQFNKSGIIYRYLAIGV